MSTRAFVPGDRGGEATQDVATQLAALTRALPSIEPFGSDNVELAGLPKFPDCFSTAPVPVSQLSVAWAVRDEGMAALAVIKCHQDALDGLKAREIARILGAAAVEAELLSLDKWQDGVAASCTATEIAMVLGIPERTASGLEHHSMALVRDHPGVLEALEAGELSWRHATIINDEIHTLKETPNTTPEEAATLEARLLVLSAHTTVASFAGKARRARERMHPETITTRTKEAFRKRNITCESGTDGMSWLTIHLPTVSASAIYTHCTRLARTLKTEALRAQHAANAAGTGQDCHEYRTLNQLRADIATILLLGQDLPTTTTTNKATPNKATPNKDPRTSTTTTPPATGNQTPAGTNNPNTRHEPNTPNGSHGSSGPRNSREPGASSNSREPDASSEPGGSPFGQNSAVGVTLIEQCDIPPWAHSNYPSNDVSGNDVNGNDVSGTRDPDTSPLPEGTALFEGTILPSTNELADPAGHSGTAGTAEPESSPAPRTGADAYTDPYGDDEPVDVLTGELVGDGSGMVAWIVDGIPEDPHTEYLQQLQNLAHSKTLTDPPLPEALVIITVPFLALLGLTDEPAELAGPQGGPIPQEIARKLLANASSFLRVLTDPISGDALPLDPTRYTVRDADRTALQALAGGCYVPNCQNPVMDTELDHLRAFEFGGASTITNLRPACKRHHYMRHFKDDKNRRGERRSINEPERQQLQLRGWTPKVTDDGRVGWITPSGTYQPPLNTDPQHPSYPKWLKKLIKKSLSTTRKPKN